MDSISNFVMQLTMVLMNEREEGHSRLMERQVVLRAYCVSRE